MALRIWTERWCVSRLARLPSTRLLIGCGVKAGDEVLVQSFTFCASSHPITYLGAKPVFVGLEQETWNMDPALLEQAILDRKEKTGRLPKAIVPVALYGMSYRIDEIMAIAEKYGIPVVEDAAEGMGSRFDGRVLGTFGGMACSRSTATR